MFQLNIKWYIPWSVFIISKHFGNNNEIEYSQHKTETIIPIFFISISNRVFIKCDVYKRSKYHTTYMIFALLEWFPASLVFTVIQSKLKAPLLHILCILLTMTATNNTEVTIAGQRSDKITTIIFDVDDTLYDVGTVSSCSHQFVLYDTL